jgi:predicted nucleic acid-binding Zn ribbon protein
MQNVYNPRCEKCGRWMRMVYTPAAVVYKGEGFAKKDRAKKEGK